MKVFGIGLNKTGTTTLGECFKVLGFRHAPYDRRLLYRMADGDPLPALEVSDRWDSFEDWPWPLLYRELDRRHPDAHFVLTERRTPQQWFDSLRNHSERAGTPRVREIVYGHPMPHGHDAELIAFYETHGRAVCDHFADRPGKLLVACWETAARWDELCAFLGLEAPDRPFPHANPRPSPSPSDESTP